MEDIKIAIGCDHAGYQYKQSIKDHLVSKGIQVIDYGTFGSDSVDYPDFVHPVAQDLEHGRVNYGVLICGSGNGVAITANKYKNVRCALCWTSELAALAVQHNNANAIALPARFVSIDNAIEMVDEFLSQSFEGGRHLRRVNKMTPQKEYYC